MAYAWTFSVSDVKRGETLSSIGTAKVTFTTPEGKSFSGEYEKVSIRPATHKVFAMETAASPKYLVEIILVVNVKDFEEARKIANYIADISIPDRKIEEKIETMRVEKIVQVKSQKQW